MADSSIPITAGSGTPVDTRTNASGDHRQVVVVGDPDTDAAVAEVQNAAPGVSDYGVATRPIGGVAGTPAGSVLSVQGVASGTNLPVAVATALPAGTANIGDVDVLSLPALPAGTNSIGTVAAPAITKGTQAATGFTVQDLHNAGRSSWHYFSNVAVAGASAEALLSLTGMKNFVSMVSTTTPPVVAAGKTLRVTRFAATFVASATSVYAVFKLRVNPIGAVTLGQPIVAVLIVGAGTPATANSSNSQEATIPDGIEIPAGGGLGITCQTFNGTTATNGGFVAASVLGFEY